MTQESTKQWLDHCDAHEKAIEILCHASRKCHDDLQRFRHLTPEWRRAANGIETLSRIISYMLVRSQAVIDEIRSADRHATRAA